MARAVFRNRSAHAIWIFMGIWMGFLCLFTWIVVRDGPPQGYSAPTMWAILSLFWLFGTAISAGACSVRAVHLEVTDTGALLVTWRSPFGAERRRVEAADAPLAEMIYGKDSDGDPTFTSRVTLADGATIDLAQGHDEASIEAITTRYNTVAGRKRGPLKPIAS